MIFISHRGNIDGIVESKENNPEYIDLALQLGYDVEIDVWMINNEIWLGHDKPQYLIDLNWIEERKSKAWIHCKNIDAIYYFNYIKSDINYFWHENDRLTLTSKGILWAYPSLEKISNSIDVLPERFSNFHHKYNTLGICSDYISIYFKNYKK